MVDLTALGVPLTEIAQDAQTEHAKAQQQLLQRMGATDQLTRAYNRDFFDMQFDIQWNIAARKKESLTLFLVDVDQFSDFNDRHDRRSADYALQKITRLLKLLFRRASDFVARYQDDRFMILAADMSADEAKAHAARICDRVLKLKILDEPPRQYLTVSVGYAVQAPLPSKQPQTMIRRVKQSLGRAKSQGKNQFSG